jgi:outer membrane lipoprotein SlyB
MRSRDGYRGMGEMGMERATGSKNAVGGALLSYVINGTIGRGRGQVFSTVEGMVSVLDAWVVGLDVLMNGTY